MGDESALGAEFRWEDIVLATTERSGPYIVSEDEIIEFARKFDPLPIHVDREVAAASMFGGITAAGSHILAIRQRLLYDFDFPKGVIASLGYEDVRFLGPLRAGQACVVEVEFLEARESRSQPDRGILITKMTLLADEVAILTMRDVALMRRRPQGDAPVAP